MRQYPSLLTFHLLLVHLLLLASLVLMILFGETDFNRLKMTGPYEVGYKDIRSTKLDNEVSVFYPINRGSQKRMIRNHNFPWFCHGDKTLRGIAKASVPYGSEYHPPMYIFRYLQKIMMNIVF